MNQPVLQPLELVIQRILEFLPNLVGGILILAFGLLFAWLVKRLVVRLLILVRLDRLFAKMPFGNALQKGDVRYPIIELIGSLLFVVIFLIFLEDAVRLWHLEILSRLIDSSILFLPRLFLGLLVLTLGLWIAKRVGQRCLQLFEDEKIEKAYFISRLARAWILIFVVALILVLVDIAPNLVMLAFSMVFGAISLSVALAVGLGSRDVVNAIWMKFLSEENGNPQERQKPTSKQP